MCNLAPVYRDNDSEQSITSFVGSKLSFLDSGLVGFSEGDIKYFLKANNLFFEVNCEFCPVDWT